MTSQMDLLKLTVPQLRAICKARGIVGYSKLTKAALLQKLSEAESAVHPTTSVKEQPQDPVAVSRPLSAKRDETVPTPGCPNHVLEPSAINVLIAAHQVLSSSNPLPSNGVAIALSRSSNAELPLHGPGGALSDGQRTHITAPHARKRVRVVSPSPSRQAQLSSLSAHAHEPAPVVGAVNVLSQTSLSTPKTTFDLTNPHPKCKDNVVHRRLPTQNVARRFKPLTISDTEILINAFQSNEKQCKEPDPIPLLTSTLDVSHTTLAPLPLVNITLPPTASGRKRVYNWAIILSRLDDAGRQACCLVSRTIRYAGRRST